MGCSWQACTQMCGLRLPFPRVFTWAVALGLTSRQNVVALLSREGSAGAGVLLPAAGPAAAMWDTLQRSIRAVMASAPVLVPRSARAARHAGVTCNRDWQQVT